MQIQKSDPGVKNLTAVCNVYKPKYKNKFHHLKINIKIIYQKFIFSLSNVQNDDISINQSII